MREPAIEARGVVKTFVKRKERGVRSWLPGQGKEEITAVDGVDLDVPVGAFFGLLGPNGAGKTTLVKLMATLLLPTRGTVRVAGLDVETHSDAVRRKVGVVLGGERALYWRLTARENLWYFSQLYNMPSAHAHARIDDLLERVGLASRADDRVENYSKGMKQRLHIARGLLNDPEILLLDEPTIGLDPHAARSLRALVRDVVTKEGRTVVLTTHYMQEADDLSDRIAVVNRGRVIAEDTPAALKRRHGTGNAYAVTVKANGASARVRDVLAGTTGVTRVLQSGADTARGVVTYRVLADARADADALAGDLAHAVATARERLVSVTVEEPTLEDVFIDLTGEKLDTTSGAREENGGAPG